MKVESYSVNKIIFQTSNKKIYQASKEFDSRYNCRPLLLESISSNDPSLAVYKNVQCKNKSLSFYMM